MSAIITLLIPNYNRASALRALLQSFYKEIEEGSFFSLINVVVVDDFSTEPIQDVINEFNPKSNFYFYQQKEKCGNAERAFLAALDFVSTDYVWLFGNDDELLPGGLSRIMPVILSKNNDFILLNPLLKTAATSFIAIESIKNILSYRTTKKLFFDFGFMTTTTTFSNLIMKAEPIRKWHKINDLTKISPVYSHSFSIFASFENQPSAFVQVPCTSFTMSEAAAEQKKLQQQAPDHLMFYHQSLGIMRLINATEKITGTKISWFGNATEDEVNKDTLTTTQISLAYLILRFTVAQLTKEQTNISISDRDFSYFMSNEIVELQNLFYNFNDEFLLSLFTEALQIYNTEELLPKIKVASLISLQNQIQISGNNKALSFSRLSNLKGNNRGLLGFF